MIVRIPLLADTAALGRVLAAFLSSPGAPSVLLLQGALGAGKTTLVRCLVEALPGGENAEVSSPSFTLCNLYDCTPPVAHFDLYRLEPWQENDELGEAVEMAENGDLLLIIEWPERMKENLLPRDFIYCSLTGEEKNRTARLKANSEIGLTALRRFARLASEAGLSVRE